MFIRLGAATLIVVAIAAVAALPTSAETLREAFLEAYANNPTLNQQRAEQRTIDEQVPQAKVGLRPTVGLTLSGVYNRTDNPQGYSTPPLSNTGTGSVTFAQPIYTGGRTAAAVRAAEATVYAGREGLRTAEAQTLGAVVLAYEDVRRDELTLAVQNDDLEFLRSQRDEIRARQKVGDVTRTDVSQAEAQLLDTRASIAATRGQLDADRAEYAAVVGHLPGPLATEEALPGLPKTVDEAFDLVEQSNPSLNQARQTAQASKARVDEARAADRPTITLQAAFGSNGTLVPAYARNFERTIEGQAVINQPIFNGGQNASQIRQAKAEANRDRIGIEVARRSAVQSAAQAWGQMLANRNDAETRDAEVVAALATLEGERQEYRAGLRSTLEVLIAEQTLRDARIAAVAARRQAYLAEVGVLSATGRLEIRYLAPEAPLYDPAKPYGQIKDAGGLPWDGALRAIDGLVR